MITGRSTVQGIGISRGKAQAEYREETSTVGLSRADMERSGLSDGASVLLKTEFGEADAKCKCADLPQGLAFMAFGSVCNRLIGAETCASGMPDAKNVSVDIIPRPK